MGEASEEAWKAAADAVAARYAEQADAAMKVAQGWERRGVALLQRAVAAEARVKELEARYRMERSDHIEASESYVKAAKEREDWRLRAVEAERTEDDFARQYDDTLARAEKAEARVKELEAEFHTADLCLRVATKASVGHHASKAELIREVEEWNDNRVARHLVSNREDEQLSAILDKHRGQP